MKIRFGIMFKLFSFYFGLITIFYCTILALFIHIQQIMRVSEGIVSQNYRISSAAKKMIENLLWMAESESKYNLLQKEEYKEYFVAAQREFEGNLTDILALETPRPDQWTAWQELYRDYLAQLPPEPTGQNKDEEAATPWIPEEIINEWVQRVSKARSENEQNIEMQMRDLNQRGRMAVRWGLVGLGSSVVIGLLGSVFLTRSMNRPLRELRRGIRSISQEGSSLPIQVLSGDEFGELAGAFNDMATRLHEEERMRSDFISMLSHEIRTPLTSIRESVNLIVEEVMGPVNERQARFLRIASHEIERISTLLNDLMQVSRLEAGAVKIQPRPFDAVEFVQGGITRAMPAAEAKGIVLRAEIRETTTPLSVMGDPENLQQVLLNLLGNAIKFSPAGTEIVVCVAYDPTDGQRLRFAVSDQGPGITPEEQSLVFHKYYRSASSRDQVDGVGLGLSISRHIVEAQGGRIWVENNPGGGSTFFFSLPLVQET